jgi:hypothetical protein
MNSNGWRVTRVEEPALPFFGPLGLSLISVAIPTILSCGGMSIILIWVPEHLQFPLLTYPC